MFLDLDWTAIILSIITLVISPTVLYFLRSIHHSVNSSAMASLEEIKLLRRQLLESKVMTKNLQHDLNKRKSGKRSSK